MTWNMAATADTTYETENGRSKKREILLGIEKLPQRKKDAAAVWFLNQMEEKLLAVITETAAKQGVYLKVTALKAESDHPAKVKTETS